MFSLKRKASSQDQDQDQDDDDDDFLFEDAIYQAITTQKLKKNDVLPPPQPPAHLPHYEHIHGNTHYVEPMTGKRRKNTSGDEPETLGLPAYYNKTTCQPAFSERVAKELGPALNSKIRVFNTQLASLEFITGRLIDVADPASGIILADEQGGGKTLTGLFSVIMHWNKLVQQNEKGLNPLDDPEGKRAVILVPNNVLLSWVNEVNRLVLPHPNFFGVLDSNTKNPQDVIASHFCLLITTSYLSYSKIPKGLGFAETPCRKLLQNFRTKLSMVIIDEADAVVPDQISKNSNLDSLTKSMKVFACVKEFIGSLRKVLLCTGTPFLANMPTSKFANLIFLANAIGPWTSTDHPFFAMDVDYWLSKMSEKHTSTGSIWRKKFISSFVMRRTLTDIRQACGIPAPTVHHNVLPVNVTQEDNDILCEEENMAVIEVRRALGSDSPCVLDVLTKLRQYTELSPWLMRQYMRAKQTIDADSFERRTTMSRSSYSAWLSSEMDKKLPDLLKAADDHGLSHKEYYIVTLMDQLINKYHHKAVIFSVFKLNQLRIKQLLESLNIPVFYFSQDLTDHARTKMICDFNDSPTPAVFLSSVKLCGRGINLQSARHLLMLTTEFNPAMTQQALARVNRLSTPHSHIFQWQITTASSFDTWVAKAVSHDRKVLHSRHHFEEHEQAWTVSCAISAQHPGPKTHTEPLTQTFCQEIPLLRNHRLVSHHLDIHSILSPFDSFLSIK